ncbi:unnamed protein product [Meganyctiphanes norvegica]|uniref:Chitin-binding type-2 domain-containing protein n=1 Tax=Meganyctiphanes norvegica TaxID=48144 RepID=A0AAV2Q129_MEGNR
MAALLLMMVMLATTQASMDFSIETTWNGSALPQDQFHPKLILTGKPNGSLEVKIEAQFFNDPQDPGGKPGLPFFGLWEYEVVEAFFLNNDDEYLEVEVCPWGQHIVLMLAGQSNAIRHSLPLEVITQRGKDTWMGTAIIPSEYLPKSVTKFNAYAIHGSGDNRVYEALYPAPSSADAPNFHALQYFKPIDLSNELPSQSSDPMSEFWQDALQGVYPYSITTDWKGEILDQEPIKISIQGFEAGVELNVSAPFFNDPKPDGPEGPFFGLWDYEVVEMFFLNDNDEYLEVEVGPWGHHIVLLLKGERNTLEHSLALDYFANRDESTWTGSAMIPPTYFPPNVTRMNAYAIHGVGDNRVYQALYPAPADSAAPDFHRLELFQPLDFEYQVKDNSEYSDIWLDAIDSSMEDKETYKNDEEANDILTSLGPFATRSTTEIPARRASSQSFTTEITTEIPEEAEATTLSSSNQTDEKELEMSSQNIDIKEADNKDTEQAKENKNNVHLRPLTRRPSIRQRPTTRKSVTRSPARPTPVQINNSRRPIQNRRLDDDRHSSGNFLPDQKFPTEVLRPTQFLRPIQKPVPQIVERPPQEEIKFIQEDEKLQILTEEKEQQQTHNVQSEDTEENTDINHQEEILQRPNVQNEDQPQSFDGIVKDTTTVMPGTEDNTDIIPQEENPQSASLVPLQLQPHPVCREAGLIPDLLRCMVFHECVIENGQWQMYSWRCKRGHYYDPHTVSCQRGRCNLR